VFCANLPTNSALPINNQKMSASGRLKIFAVFFDTEGINGVNTLVSFSECIVFSLWFQLLNYPAYGFLLFSYSFTTYNQNCTFLSFPSDLLNGSSFSFIPAKAGIQRESSISSKVKLCGCSDSINELNSSFQRSPGFRIECGMTQKG